MDPEKLQLATLRATRTVTGYAFPGIICNGGSYFLTDLKVYADGLIDCWEMVDLPLFKERLKAGWVAPSMSEGASLSCHGLGAFQVCDANWAYNQRSLLRFIKSVIKDLNPRMENLYNCHGRTTEEVNGARYAVPSGGQPRAWKPRLPINPFADGLLGDTLRHFQVVGEQRHLVTVQLFEDDTVVISGAGPSETLEFAEFAEHLNRGDKFRFPDPGERVVFKHLVEFTMGEWQYRVEAHDLEAEFHDTHSRVHGKPGAVQECRRAFEEYSNEPTEANREQLKEIYEAVPEHLRTFCGDMDVKDIPIRMALYGEEEIENWSHYQVAKAQGEKQLPSISVPKVEDEKEDSSDNE